LRRYIKLENVHVSLNYEKTKELKEILWQSKSWFSRDEFERSDLIYCPVKGYNRCVGLKPRIPMKLSAIFVIGEALHTIIQSKFDLVEVKQKMLPNVNVRYDLIWGKKAEIKTTRMNMFRPSHIPKIYLDQLEAGLAFTKDNDAYLITFDIVNTCLLVWDVVFDRKYLASQVDKYFDLSVILEDSVRFKNPFMLKPKFEECPTCLYSHNCQVLNKK